MKLLPSSNPTVSLATEDIATEGPKFDPATHGKLRDSEHCTSAGLLNHAAAPASCWTKYSCLDPSWIGSVEFNPASPGRPAILTIITSDQTQRDRRGQLYVQFALTRAIPETSDVTLHQNHAAPEGDKPTTAYWIDRENPRDVDRYHTLGLPKGGRGERLAHYHLTSEALSLDMTRHILSSLSSVEINGLPLVTTRDAAAILNTLYPAKKHTRPDAIAVGSPTPLFDKHMTDREVAKESDRLQRRYYDLCTRHIDRAEANQTALLDVRQYLPVNQRPSSAASRAAASSACLTFGNTRDGAILSLASDMAEMSAIYNGPQGVLKILQMRRYLAQMPARFPDIPSLKTEVQTAISNIDRVLGRDHPSKRSTDEVWHKPIPKPRL